MQTWLRSAAAAPLSWRRRHWIIVGLMLVLTASIGIFAPRGARATHDPAAQALTTLNLELPPLPEMLAGNSVAAADDRDWQVATVRSGQTVGEIFGAQGISGTQLQHLLDDPANRTPRHIRQAGSSPRARADGVLRALRFDRDDRTRVR